MNLPAFPFSAIDWSAVQPEQHKGQSGTAIWRTKHLKDIRIRMVEYSQDYIADHWCSKGHILFILKGEMTTELQDGRSFLMTEGMCYLAGDEGIPHRSSTSKGAKLLIID